MLRIPSLPAPPQPLVEVWTDGTLVGPNGNKLSSWAEVGTMDKLRISRVSTGGTYVLEIHWSRDGVSVDVTQNLNIANNSGDEVLVFAPFVRFQVRNTDALAAFSSHRTNVFGR